MSEATKAPARPTAQRAAAKKELPEHFKTYKHVWVFVEQERGQVHPVSWELLGIGRNLADKLGVELAAVVLGPGGEATRRIAADAFAYGNTHRCPHEERAALYRESRFPEYSVTET